MIHAARSRREHSPVDTLHVGGALSSWGAGHFHYDAVLGLEVVGEVAITGVCSFVKQDADGFLLQLGSGGGDGEQAGEEHLREEEYCEPRPSLYIGGELG